MKKTISKTIESDNSKIEILKAGMKTEFWKIIVEAIQESKDYIQEQMDAEGMKDMTPEQYKFTNETFKAKRMYLDTLMKTPENMISWMVKVPSEKPKNFDPYGDDE